MDTAQRLDLRREQPAYADDYAAWVGHQQQLLAERRTGELDFENLIDEVGDLGSNVYDKFVSALEVILLHLLKWDFQPARRSKSWVSSIDEHRDRTSDGLRRSPSFKPRIDEAVATAYRYARQRAVRETDLPLKTFPDTCPYDWAAITTRAHPLPGDDA